MMLGGPPVREGTAASPVAGRVYVGEPLRKAVCWRLLGCVPCDAGLLRPGASVSECVVVLSV